MVLCTCLFAQDPNRFDNISYANWATIIFPINAGGGRACLFLTTLFAILSVSLSPSLQGCRQGEHPFITSGTSCPILSARQNKAAANSTLAIWTNKVHIQACTVKTHVRTNGCCYQVHTASINSLSKDLLDMVIYGSCGYTTGKGMRGSFYMKLIYLPNARNKMNCTEKWLWFSPDKLAKSCAWKLTFIPSWRNEI